MNQQMNMIINPANSKRIAFEILALPQNRRV